MKVFQRVVYLLLFVASTCFIIDGCKKDSTSSSKTVYIATAGSLTTAMSTAEKQAVANVTITGTIDARDFATMRDSLPNLANVTLAGATIVAYIGLLGTNVATNTVYAANTIPEYAFCYVAGTYAISKSKLSSVILPVSIVAIGDSAFYNCNGLQSLSISAATPPAISATAAAFTGIPATLCTLYVPVGSKTAYQQATGWNAFTTIVEK